MSDGFWHGREVTVTGGTGFLGSRVAARLRALGSRAFVPTSREFDLTRAAEARRMYAAGRPEILIHLAARVGGIAANMEQPGLFFHDNMAMGLNVIEQGRLYGGLKKLVLVGTTCSYPKFTAVPFQEEELWNGFPEETNAPYGVAKRALLAMLWGYRQQYGMNGIYLIPANLYGPSDNMDPRTSHVIPALLRKFVEAKEVSAPQVTVWGTGRASREFLYVDDAAEGIVLAAEKYEKPDPVNLGTGQEITIADLAKAIRRVTGFQGEIVWDASKPDGQLRRSLDTSRAEAGFGFRASTTFESGLARTLEWYLADRVPR